MLSGSDKQRLIDSTFVTHVAEYTTLGSTNDEAKALCQTPSSTSPYVVITSEQTAGRGRGTNRWLSGPGALTFSLAVPKLLVADPSGDATIALRMALAVRAAVASFLPIHCNASVKWPNDVVVEGRKISGILIESVAANHGWFVIGIGLNVANRVEDFAFAATSLACNGADVSIADALIRVVAECESQLTHPSDFVTAWPKHCWLTGKRIRIDSRDGVCRGIDASGALRLESPEGTFQVRSGAVVVLD